MIYFHGHCRSCNTVHRLPCTPAAVSAAEARIDSLKKCLPEGKGRMLGVLLGKDHAGFDVTLQAYSGTTQLEGLELGWAPTTRLVNETLDQENRTFETLNKLSAELESLDWAQVDKRAAEEKQRYKLQQKALQKEREESRLKRAARRAEAPQDETLKETLDQESWEEGKAYRKALAEKRKAYDDARSTRTATLEKMGAIKEKRKHLSNALQNAFLVQHHLTNFNGVTLPIEKALKENAPLRLGVGECAAPKLLQDAARRGIQPYALAELWVGTPQPDPPRQEGLLYGPCEERCIPILGHLLCGAKRPPSIGPSLALQLVHESATWVAVNKAGLLLSVPGRGRDKVDSVVTRLRGHYSRGAKAQAAHRLDMETSGIMVVALKSETQTELNRQFLGRTTQKTYFAWLEGRLTTGQGALDLPLAPESRSSRKQVVSPQGKEALTEFQVIGHAGERTLVEFSPRTGRSHQLRVHAAVGLNAPIVGDNLYGTEGPHLLLHAGRIRFDDPDTKECIELTAPLPVCWPRETRDLLDAYAEGIAK